jgi:hypothetical protein
MYSVSSNFNAAANANARQILVRAYINDTLLNGDNLIDLTVTEAVNASGGLSIGTTISSKLTAKIKMPETPLLLTDSIIRPEVSFYGVDEWVPLGKFYITDAVSDNDFNTAFTITAYDGFCTTETPYVPKIPMPNTAPAILADIAAQCGFSIEGMTDGKVTELPTVDEDGILTYINTPTIDEAGVLNFSNSMKIVSGGVLTIVKGVNDISGEFGLLELTQRQYIGYFAGLIGYNARFNRSGNLELSWYADSGYSVSRNSQYMGGFKRLTENDFALHSITSGTSDNMFTSGSGVGISFDNPFITQAILDDIFDDLKDVSYTPAQVKWRGNPAIEAGDIIIAEDQNGVSRQIYVMEQTIQVGGGLYSEIKCYGESETSMQFSTSPQAKKLQQVYTKLQAAIAEATQLLNGANGGVFEILDENKDGINDGWIIHSPDFQRFIKANLNGIGITNDGGATYEQAMTVDGINASAIHTGQMSAQRISVGDETLGDVFSVALDKDGHPVVTIGSSDSVVKQKQTHDAITFVDNQDTQVAKFSTTGAEWADLQQMKYCGFIWTKSSASGNVRFTKVGEN